MYREKTIGVVIPAYNEVGLVGDVIESLPSFVDRVYVIDDCSTDGTWAEIRTAAAAVNGRVSDHSQQKAYADGGRRYDPTVVTTRHSENLGVGGAIKTGYRQARDDDLDVVAVVNGDGQMDPAILDRIVDPVVDGWADYAKGDRLSRRTLREEMSTWRLFGNTVLTFLTKTVSGYWRMTDPQNGYTAISAHALETIDIDRLYDDFGFCNDLLVHLNVHDMRIADVEMESKYRDETSHIAYSSFVPKLSWLLLKRALWRWKTKYVVADFHPLVFLYLLGFVGAGVGVTALGWALVSAGMGVITGLLSVIVVMLGGLFVVLAMIFDRTESAELERHVEQRVREGNE
ncbi:glycosyltransferase family 2 protein [Natrialbaceae archaeon AArc-T1-2]|uniref:glycosyltransferase family 2 protein n=1 Tax=Natrialbaceae archaeon AArc-T1-2 TaxID=3053904 RepID=UPI00255B3932|nr:glycosyltransferase family 2 protein [Natrialbaceae archaeon AArc-T1-2]WIV67214.1 glycosyltransferase family 2 protein [Natrialbaceae archaeon AArc-T1-2]